MNKFMKKQTSLIMYKTSVKDTIYQSSLKTNIDK